MTTLDHITQTVQRLPDHLQREVLHYTLYLAERVADQQPVAPVAAESQRRDLSEALEAASRINPFQDLSDPVSWQKDTRQDRPLPERDAP